MDHSLAASVLKEIESSNLIDLRDSLLQSAVRYARIRTDWALAEPETRKDMDRTRTAAHNSFIVSCNVLSRAMKKAGGSIRWRERLGQDRKCIGDFACQIHCLLGIRAR